MGKSAKILYYYYLTLLPIRISGGNITPPPKKCHNELFISSPICYGLSALIAMLKHRIGKIVQIMPGYFSIDDPKAHKTIYSHASPWIKGEFYIAWNVGPDPTITNLFAARDPKLHASMRRKVASMYSMSSLVSYEPYVDECVQLFYNQLETLASSRSSFNLGHWLQYFAFDAISLITVC